MRGAGGVDAAAGGADASGLASESFVELGVVERGGVGIGVWWCWCGRGGWEGGDGDGVVGRWRLERCGEGGRCWAGDWVELLGVDEGEEEEEEGEGWWWDSHD